LEPGIWPTVGTRTTTIGILSLTHTEREAVYEAVIDLTRTQLDKAKRL